MVGWQCSNKAERDSQTNTPINTKARNFRYRIKSSNPRSNEFIRFFRYYEDRLHTEDRLDSGLLYRKG